MSIKTSLNLIKEYKADIYKVIKDKGVTISANTPFSEYPNKVNSISGGGGYPYNNFNGTVTSQESVSYINTSILYGVLPDYSIYNGFNQFCLMPVTNYDYKNVPVLNPNLNPYLINNHCTIKNGIAQGFSNTNYLKIDRDLNFNTLEITLKAVLHSTSHSCVLVADSVARTELSVNGGTISFWDNSYFYGSTTFKLGTYYYVRVVIENEVSTLYTLEDTGYTFNTLPALSYWTKECEYNGVIFSNKISLGYDANYPEEYIRGNIDLNNSKIKSGNTILWEYPQAGLTTTSLQGCLMYTDNGSAKTVDAYCIKSSPNRIVLCEGTPSIVGVDVCKLGTVSVPAHTLYTYTEEELLDNYTIVGNVQVDLNTGIASSFSTGSYISLPEVFSPENNSWEVVVKVNMNSVSGRPRLYSLAGNADFYGVVACLNSGKTEWWIGNGGWFISGSSGSGTITLSTNTDYWIKLVYDTTKYVSYISEDGEEWMLDATFNDNTTIKTTNKPPFLGTGEAPGSETMDGSIYLKDSYIKLGDEIFWSGLGKRGVWTPIS